MRAKMSWPRSSVPKGWAIVGVFSRAVKSMSLIESFHKSGPNTTISTIMASTTSPATASLCRRKRRHASAAGETFRRRGDAPSIADARVEPAIEQVGDQVEENDEAGKDEGHPHDHGRVVAQDRVDEQRADAGHAKDLLGDDRAAEDLRHGERHQRHHRDECIANHVLHED